jgi:hypothetical protein
MKVQPVFETFGWRLSRVIKLLWPATSSVFGQMYVTTLCGKIFFMGLTFNLFNSKPSIQVQIISKAVAIMGLSVDGLSSIRCQK